MVCMPFWVWTKDLYFIRVTPLPTVLKAYVRLRPESNRRSYSFAGSRLTTCLPSQWGRLGIRTLGTLLLSTFQGWCTRPLCESSWIYTRPVVLQVLVSSVYLPSYATLSSWMPSYYYNLPMVQLYNLSTSCISGGKVNRTPKPNKEHLFSEQIWITNIRSSVITTPDG